MDFDSLNYHALLIDKCFAVGGQYWLILCPKIGAQEDKRASCYAQRDKALSKKTVFQ